MKKKELKDYKQKARGIRINLFYIDAFFCIVSFLLLFVQPFNFLMFIPIIGMIIHTYQLYKQTSLERVYNAHQTKERKKISYSFIGNNVVVIFTLLFMSIRLFYDNTFISYSDMWFIILPVMLLVFAINYLSNRSFSIKKEGAIQIVLGMLFMSYIMSYCCTVFFNAYFNSQPPKVYHGIIHEKVENRFGRSNTYYFKVKQGLPKDYPTMYTVLYGLYNAKEEGDSISIPVFKGALGLSYYTRNELR